MCFEEAFGSKTVYCVVKCRGPDVATMSFFTWAGRKPSFFFSLPAKKRGKTLRASEETRRTLRFLPETACLSRRWRSKETARRWFWDGEAEDFSHTRRIPLRRLSAGVCIVRAVFRIVCLGGNLESAGDSSVTEKS